MAPTSSASTARPVENAPRKLTSYNYRTILFGAFSSIVIGYCLSAVATTLGQSAFYQYMHLTKVTTSPDYHHTTVIQGLTTSLSQAGGFFGSYFNSWTADRYGRLRSFQIACCVIIVGGALTAGAVNIPMFLVFRFVSGWGVGMLQVLFPMYAAEISPPNSRGFLVGHFAIGLCVGYNLAAAVSFGTYFAKNGSFAWRFPLALQCLFPAFLFTFSFFMPESPRWLILKSRPEEARTVVSRIYQSPDDVNDDFARAEYDLMIAQIALEREKSGGATDTFLGRWKYLFSKKSYRYRAMLGFTLMFGIQCTGPTVINNYQIILYPALGVTGALPLGLYWVYVGVAFFANSASAFMIDWLGRRRSFLIGLCMILTALTGETIVASFLPSTSKAVLVLGVFFIFWFIPWYGSLIDGVMFTFTSEIWPSEIRSEGVALSMSGFWLSTIAILQASPTGFANCGWKFYLLFVFCTVAMWFFIFFTFPETGRISMEEMGGLFGDEIAGTLDERMNKQVVRGSDSTLTTEKQPKDAAEQFESDTRRV